MRNSFTVMPLCYKPYNYQMSFCQSKACHQTTLSKSVEENSPFEKTAPYFSAHTNRSMGACLKSYVVRENQKSQNRVVLCSMLEVKQY